MSRFRGNVMILKIMNKLCSRESISYIIFGVLTTAVDWLSYTALWAMGADYRVSTALSWSAAVLFAFVTNKFIVFKSLNVKAGYLWKELVSFVACRGATGIFTMAGMVVMVDMLHWNEFFGKFVVSAVSLVLNYILSKLFIFKKAGSGEEPV